VNYSAAPTLSNSGVAAASFAWKTAVSRSRAGFSFCPSLNGRFYTVRGNKVIWWLILLVIGPTAYATYLQLASALLQGGAGGWG